LPSFWTISSFLMLSSSSSSCRLFSLFSSPYQSPLKEVAMESPGENARTIQAPRESRSTR
jgi:hypothetical protein